MSSGQDSDSSGIFARRYKVDPSTGSLSFEGEEFQVNTRYVGGQFLPSIASLSLQEDYDSFVIVWQGQGDGDGDGIFAQEFFENETKNGVEFGVNKFTNGFQRDPYVVPYQGGQRYIVGWDGDGEKGSDLNIYACRCSVNGGQRIGDEFDVKTHNVAAQRSPAAASLPNRSTFIVAWESRKALLSSIYARVFFPLVKKGTASSTQNSIASVSTSLSLTPTNNTSSSMSSSPHTATPLSTPSSSASIFHFISITQTLAAAMMGLKKERASTAVAVALEGVLGDDAAKAVTVTTAGTNGAMGMVAGIPSSVAALPRLSTSLRSICGFVDDAAEPTWMEGLPLDLDNFGLSIVASCNLVTCIIIFLVKVTHTALRCACRMKKGHRHRPLEITGQIVSAIVSLTTQFWCSGQWMLTIMLLVHGPTITDRIVGAVSAFFLLLVFLSIVYELTFAFGAVASQRVRPGDEKLGPVMKSVLRTEFLDAPGAQGYVATCGFMFDATRDVTRLLTRCYFIEEMVFSAVAGIIAGTVPKGDACYIAGGFTLAISFFHVAFVVLVRGYRTKLDTFFSIASALLPMVAVVIGLIPPSLSGLDEVQGAVMLLLSALMIVQLICCGFWAFVVHHRRRLRATAEALTSSVEGREDGNEALYIPLREGDNQEGEDVEMDEKVSHRGKATQRQQSVRTNPLTQAMSPAGELP